MTIRAISPAPSCRILQSRQQALHRRRHAQRLQQHLARGVIASGGTQQVGEVEVRRDELRILETTPAYADYVWAVDENLDPTIKMRLRDAFMDLNATDPEHQDILRRLGAHAYLPASRSDFDDVRRAARMLDDTNRPEDE